MEVVVVGVVTEVLGVVGVVTELLGVVWGF